MPRCIIGPGAEADIAEIVAAAESGPSARFKLLLDVVLDALEQDNIRFVLPTLGQFVLVPMHRFQARLPPPRGRKARHMLVLHRLPSRDWYVVGMTRDSRLYDNVLQASERRLQREQP